MCARGEITLRHDNFQPGMFSLCNGAIVVERVGIEGLCYVSRLNFTAEAEFNNTVTECLIQDDERAPVGNSTTVIVPGIYGRVLSYFTDLMIIFYWRQANCLIKLNMTGH